MDEDSDVDNSLIDLHHGLDSSFDENASGVNTQAPKKSYASVSMDSHSRKDVADDHMNTLQDMVLEMKEGFQNALKELAKIQDKEEGESNHSKKLQQQQQRQLDDLTETIHEIKNQLSSLTTSVKQIKDEQKTLKDHLEEVRSNRSSSQEQKFHNIRDRMDSFSAPPDDWNTKLSDLSTEFDGHTASSRLPFETDDDDDVTVTACKSLTLTQALSDRCLKLNLSQSSDEDEKDQRVLHYAPKTTGLALGQIEHRRHSMSTITASPKRAKDVDSAAQRRKAVKELADLERDYCSQLWSLLQTYMIPLQTANFLSARELGTLFPPYLDQLYAEHCRICTGLQDRLVHWTYMGGVADLLARITDSHHSDSVLSLYKEYADDLLSAVTCLRRIQAQSSKFRSFLKALKHSSYQSEDLMSLLLAPVKHVPKYLLQLQQVFHHTLPTHSDFPLLQTSLRRLRAFVDQLNEDLSITAHALSQDRHAWSNNISGQMPSTRDSGIHSNSTEDDNVMPTKAFSKANRNHMPPEWLEEPHFIVHHRQSNDIIRQNHVRAPASRLNALSQPDLTVYNNLNSHSSDPHIFAHIPRSQSTIPAADVDSGEEAARGRQYRKFKIKRRNQSPVDYGTTSRGHMYRSLSPRVRPASAVDFLNHSHSYQQYYHQSNHRDLPTQPRKPQYQEHEARSHTVLGSRATDPSHKPTIISRKHLRRSQPHIPASTNFWAETSTISTIPFQVRHQRVPLPTRDMIPKQSSYYNTSDVLDGDDEEEEDDTRAGDTHSLGTNGSHPYSSGHGSNNGQDLDLDLYQRHSPPSIIQTSNPSHSSEFSSAEVTASLARKLCDAQQGTAAGHESLVMKQVNDVSETKTFPVLVQQSSGSSKILPSHIAGNESIKEQHMIPDSCKDMAMLNSTMSEYEGNYENDFQNTAVLPNESILNADDSVTLSPKAEQSSFHERDVSLSSRSNVIKTNSGSAKRVDTVDGGSEKIDEMKQISESNRQFLLSLSTRTPCVDRIDQNSSFSISSNSDIHSSNLTSSSVNKKNHQQSSSDASDTPSSNMRTDLGRAETNLLPWNARNGSSHTHGALILNGSPDGPSTESALAKRHSYHYPSLAGSKGDDRRTSEVISHPQKNYSNKSHIISSSNTTYPTSLQASTHDTTSHDRITSSSVESHQFHIKPLITSSTSNAFSDVAHTDATTYKDVYKCTNNFDDLSSYPDSHELPPLEIDDPAPYEDKAGRKGDLRKKLKDGGKFNSSDGLPKASDDPVGARKKMHFKSSIKNLFSKKKGQVILADVEREVVMEMTTAAAEGTATKLTKSAEYVRNTNNFIGYNSVMTSAPQKTVTESAAETKTRKEQYGRNSSPAKVCKKFQFHAKDKKFQSGGDLSESKQCKQQNVLECLKAHNKRYGIVIDSNDTQFTDALDKDIDFAGTARQDTESKGSVHDFKFQGKNGLTQFQPFLQKRPRSSYTCGTEKSGTSLCSNSASRLHQQAMSKHYQSQTVEEEPSGLRSETDPLKSTPDVCNINSILGTTKDVSELANSSKNRVRAEKYHGQSLGESLVKRSHSRSLDLCMQCQKCEMRQKEKVTDCERTLCAVKTGLTNFKNCESEACDMNLGNSDMFSVAANQNGKSEDGVSNNTGLISSNVLLNGTIEGKKPTVTEKVRHITLAPETVSCSEELKSCFESEPVCDSDIIRPVNSSHLLTCLRQQQQKQFEDRSKYYTSSQKQTTSSGCQQLQFPNLMTNNMPDVTKVSVGVACSKNIAGQNALTDVSAEKSNDLEAANIMPAADIFLGKSKIFPASSEACNIKVKNSSLILNTSLLDDCDVKRISVTQSSMSESPGRTVAPTSLSSSHYFSHSSQTMPSETRSHFKMEQSASDQLPRSRSVVLPKTVPNRVCSEYFIKEETGNEAIVKRFSLEDKEFLDHRYRLYYDDAETNTCRNLKQSENPKSLKALSASSVIAENFKQLPRDSNSSYDRSGKIYNQAAFYLTVSLPSDGLSERKASVSLVESKLIGVAGPKVSLPSHISPNLSPENLLTECNSDTLSQFADCSNIMVTRHEKLSTGNNYTEVPQINCSHSSLAAEMDMMNGKYSDLLPPDNLESKDNETSPKLYQMNTSLEKERNTFSSEMSENSSGLQTTAPFSDESSSYKPKNPQPVINLLLSNAPECQSSRHLKGEKPSTNYPHFSMTNLKSEYVLNSENKTTGSSLNLPPVEVSASCNHESNVQLTRKNGHKTNDAIKGPESYRCQQSGNDSLYKGSHRSSSPSDLFSIRPYVDYTASKASSDSGILVFSDTARSMKSTVKGSSSEKLDKSRRQVGNKKVKSGSEKDDKFCKSQNKCTEKVSISDDVEHHQSNYSRRSRHSDGVKIRAQEQKCYQLHYPRYSADSSSLISNAFLEKMAHLSQHPMRPMPHDDIHLNSSSKHNSISGDPSRKTQGPHGTVECCASVTTQSSRNTRMTLTSAKNAPLTHSSSFNTSKDEIPPVNCEHHKSRISSASTDITNTQASPDLLPSSDDLKEEGATKEKSQLSKKAQSFFSKLTHSPIAFFYRDTKSSNPPK